MIVSCKDDDQECENKEDYNDGDYDKDEDYDGDEDLTMMKTDDVGDN